jgi:uroporphyrin-III C-methyltransferase
MATGIVILGGAGPGDAELITIKLVDRLRKADLVMVDRLVNPEIINQYIRPGIPVIEVGKQGYAETSTQQTAINDLLIQYANQYNVIVRLKGGDVSVYSNALHEIEALKAAGIPFEIVPGITAASGAAASLAISLTGRDIAPGVQFQTLSTGEEAADQKIKEWALSQDTIVFYMSIGPLKKLISEAIIHGAENKMMAIIEQATTPAQLNRIGTIGDFGSILHELDIQSPALVIWGDILRLAISNHPTGDSVPFFKSLHSFESKIKPYAL